MLLTMCLLDVKHTERRATALVDVASIEYDFTTQTMILHSVIGVPYFKRVSLDSYERLCNSFNLNADFKNGKMLNMNSLGNFIKSPVKGETVTKEQWEAALQRTVPSWDSPPAYAKETDPFAL